MVAQVSNLPTDVHRMQSAFAGDEVPLRRTKASCATGAA
jgi:hypothetical protein